MFKERLVEGRFTMVDEIEYNVIFLLVKNIFL